MKFKKPDFWDLKKPNLIAYLLLPFSYLISLIVFFYKKEKIKTEKIKTICVGNIYVGGTGKTPTSININNILIAENFKTAFIKKKYSNQIDEQKILSSNGTLFCDKVRANALKLALDQNFDIAIFDDGLQDESLVYDVTIVCFNSISLIGNGLCLPSGPLRESLKSLKKYDAVILNGNGEENLEFENIIKKIKPELEIFKGEYTPINLKEFDLDNNYLAFSGIGNPNSFLKTLKKNKFSIIKKIIFPDHYHYSNKDIEKIKDTAKTLGAKIITTEKDYNRLNKLQSNDIDFLKIKLKILDEQKFKDFFYKKI